MPPIEMRSPRLAALAGLLVLVGAWFGLGPSGVLGEPGSAAPTAARETGDEGVARVCEAFVEGTSDLWITLEATVERTLKDDDEGSRHQRFILRLTNDLTVLVAHNIDLAPRVPLGAGDRVRLRGEYEWNDKGGVIHWTHAHADGRPRGWIEHQGERYQ